MEAWDFIVHNLDYDGIQEEYDSALFKFSSQALHEDLKWLTNMVIFVFSAVRTNP